MRLLVLLFALAMPAIAWISQMGVFGPTQEEISSRHPNLLLPAGYAFSIWLLIFALALVYAVWQLTGSRRHDRTLLVAAPYAAGGFALTAIWMPLFSLGLFAVCLLVIFGALACMTRAASLVARFPPRVEHGYWLARLPLSLHAGWLTLAAFVNLAQVAVAYNMLPERDMLGWSLVVLALAAAVLFLMNHRMAGNIPYAAAAAWGLVAVYVKQTGWDLGGSETVGWIALALALALLAQTALLVHRRADQPGARVRHHEPRTLH